MARPSKLTPELQTRIVTAMQSGVPGEVAAQACGICSATFYAWKARGERESSGAYAEFLEAIKTVEANVEVTCAQMVRMAMPVEWQAAMTMLERRWPQRWSRQDRLEVTLRHTAERLASELGLDVNDLINEAERIVATAGVSTRGR